MKRQRNELSTFLIGIIMLAAGLYWFLSSVTVTTGFYTRIFSYNAGGMIIIPFIVGIAWLFVNPDSFAAKLVIVIGLVIIIASVIAGTKFYFKSKDLYEYLIMLVFIVGGASLTLKVLLFKPKDYEDKKTK